MFSQWNSLRHGAIALATCLVVVLSYASLGSRVLAQAPMAALPPLATAVPGNTAVRNTFAVGEQIDTNLAAATAPLLAQGTNQPITTYIAMLSGSQVVPNAARTDARGVVGAALSGNRLVVRGSFRELSSALRDFAVDPVDPPNPNITSAFHVHRGAPSENGPFQYAIQVTLNSDGRSGSGMGDYTLTPEQLQALQSGQLYIDLHTTRNRGGELRGILMPA